METKTQHRKPEFVYLEKPSQIRELIPGDLVSLAIGGGFGGQLYEFHAVYEGELSTNFNNYDFGDNDRKSKTLGFSFLDVDFFQYLKGKECSPSISSYRIKNPEKDIIFEGESNITNYVKRDFNLERDFYLGERYPQKMLEKKLRLIQIGERLLRKLYTFDEVIIQDNRGNAIKKLKNIVVR